MKAKFRCKVDKIHLDKDAISFSIIDNDGKVDVKAPTAQSAKFWGTLTLKPLIGNSLKVGSIFQIEMDILEQEGL